MAAKWKTAVQAIAIGTAGLFTLSLVSGILYEQAQRARERQRYPQVGRSFDIGGRSLNLDCAGTGRPAVILESGANWAIHSGVYDPRTMFANGGPRPGFSWAPVQRALAGLTTVCWYDRAGSGWSDAGPYPRDIASQAHDLHALLRAAGVAAPFVLVGESSAGLDARVYAGFYPGDVAGMVLVNWADPALLLDPQTNNGKRAARVPQWVYHLQDTVARISSFVGFYRLGRIPAAPPHPVGLTEAEWNTIWYFTHSSRAIAALLQDIASWRLSSAEARAAGDLGGRPLLVLGAEAISAPLEFREAWRKAQRDLASRSTRGRQTLVGGGAIDLLYDAPDAITEAVRQVVAEVRTIGH